MSDAKIDGHADRSAARCRGSRRAPRSPAGAEYIHNLRVPGMLHAKIYRSTIPHGRIRGIDTDAAKAMPGVHSVVIGEDILAVIPDPYYGPAFHDQPILALGKVRFAGEPVAVVARRGSASRGSRSTGDRSRIRGASCGLR